MFETLMSLQIQTTGSEAESKEEKVKTFGDFEIQITKEVYLLKVAQLAADVAQKIPEPIDYENTEKLIGAEKTPLDVVLLQEIARYNIQN